MGDALRLTCLLAVLTAHCAVEVFAQEASTLPAEQCHQRALELEKAGDTQGAGEWFKRAWEAEPHQSVYGHDLAIYYIHAHLFPEALAVIREIVKRDGATVDARVLQGEWLFEQKQYDLAYQTLRSALDIDTTNYRAHELIGLILVLHRSYQAALAELKIAANQNPNSAQVHFYCGRLYYKNADYTDARDEMLACLRINPTYPEALEDLGLSYEAIGEAGNAEARYREAITLEKSGAVPRSESPYTCLATLLAKQGQEKEAMSLLEQGLARNPASAWANFELGKLYFKSGDDKTAERYLKRSVALDNRYSRPHFFLAKIYHLRNQSEAADSELAVFRELDKDIDNREPQKTR